jgi:hypothetical protein
MDFVVAGFLAVAAVCYFDLLPAVAVTVQKIPYAKHLVFLSTHKDTTGSS